MILPDKPEVNGSAIECEPQTKVRVSSNNLKQMDRDQSWVVWPIGVPNNARQPPRGPMQTVGAVAPAIKPPCDKAEGQEDKIEAGGGEDAVKAVMDRINPAAVANVPHDEVDPYD